MRQLANIIYSSLLYEICFIACLRPRRSSLNYRQSSLQIDLTFRLISCVSWQSVSKSLVGIPMVRSSFPRLAHWSLCFHLKLSAILRFDLVSYKTSLLSYLILMIIKNVLLFGLWIISNFIPLVHLELIPLRGYIRSQKDRYPNRQAGM